MADFNNIFGNFDKLRQSFEGLGDVKGDVKEAVTELRKFNSGTKEAVRLLRTFNDNSAKLIPLLERITPRVEEGFDLLAKMDQKMDNISALAEMLAPKTPPTATTEEDK